MSVSPAKSKQLTHWQSLIAAAKINPVLARAMLNDIELQWSMLVNSGQAQNVRRDEFIRWSFKRRSSPGPSGGLIAGIDDLQLRHKFIRDAMRRQNRKRIRA